MDFVDCQIIKLVYVRGFQSLSFAAEGFDGKISTIFRCRLLVCITQQETNIIQILQWIILIGFGHIFFFYDILTYNTHYCSIFLANFAHATFDFSHLHTFDICPHKVMAFLCRCVWTNDLTAKWIFECFPHTT